MAKKKKKERSEYMGNAVIVKKSKGKTEKWYERKTNRNANRGKERIKKINKYLKKNKLKLNEVKLENHADYKWNKRRNRKQNEKRAISIGQTNSRYSSRVVIENWWVVPKK